MFLHSHFVDDESPRPLARPDHSAPMNEDHDSLLGLDLGTAEDEGLGLLRPNLQPLEAPLGLQEVVNLLVHDQAYLLISSLIICSFFMDIKLKSFLCCISIIINFS